MVFNLNLVSPAAFQTVSQVAQAYAKTLYVASAYADGGVSPADNVLPIKKFSSLNKKARARVSQFDRDFLI